MVFKNRILGIDFSSPPKNYEVIKLLVKMSKERNKSSDKNYIDDLHLKNIENDLLSWNLIDANHFKKIFSEESLKCEELNASSKNLKEYGLSLKQWFEIGALLIVLGLIGYGIFSYFNSKEERDFRNKAKNEYYSVVAKSQVAVEMALKDSNSAKFKDQNYNCGYVNAKNSFGAYTGYKRYIVALNQVYLEDSNATPTEISNLWDSACPK